MLIPYGYEITLNARADGLRLLAFRCIDDHGQGNFRVPERVFTTPSFHRRPIALLSPIKGLRLVAPDGDLTLWGDATIEIPVKPEGPFLERDGRFRRRLPSMPRVYLMGADLAKPDRLSRWPWGHVRHSRAGMGRVQGGLRFGYQHIKFDICRRARPRTAFEVFNERIGVCRDFGPSRATLCRASNPRPTMSNGHLGDIGVTVVDPMDLSAG